MSIVCDQFTQNLTQLTLQAFTSETQQEWKNGITVSIQKGVYGYISIVWYIGFVGVMYQLVGLMAKEREFGMSDLVESMMPNVRRWEPQLARLIAHHIAFTITYAPSWIIMAVFFKVGLFPHGSIGILIIFFILAGLALVSCSIFGAAFFRKAQLSGISTVVLILILGIIAQIEVKKMDAATVAILSLFFTPMTFVFCLSSTSRFEAHQVPINILHVAPGSPWSLAPGIFWIFFIVQIFAYPIFAVYAERWLYGTASKRSRREVSWDDGQKTTPVQLTNFRKVYEKNWFLRTVDSIIGHKPTPVVAIDDLSINALQGQIMVLVGANGCGKTTVLNAIAGLSSITGGSIALDGSGGIGLCPQKNVLWNGLTVEQHARIFYTLKTVNPGDMSQDIARLINLCGLDEKRKSYARTLSGGQKRKLQLIMMLIGGSRVCCVDEVSGGLDPLSRRRVWDILLAERGRRTFILTTHFLDEAEYLADHMTIISRGRLKAEGSTSELKARLGNGYRFSVPPGTENLGEDEVAGLSGKLHAEETFSTTDTKVAMEKIKSYRAAGVKNYQIAGPTIEEVFMKLAVEEDANTELGEQVAHEHFLSPSPPSGADGHEKGSVLVDVKTADSTLLTGRRIGSIPQAWILIKKRLIILRWNWVGYLACFLIPVIAAGMVTLLLKHFDNPGCAFLDQISLSDTFNLSSSLAPELVVGPRDALTPQRLELFTRSLPNSTDGVNVTTLLSSFYFVDSLTEFNDFTNTNYSTIVPGGLYLGGAGEIPTFNYRSDIGTLGIYSAIYLQNAMDIVLTNQSIVTSYGKSYSKFGNVKC
jgi:ATP-binding cassette subfamily A (ABC1) protein 3